MNDLKSFTEWLYTLPHPGDALMLADSYMRHYNKVGASKFMLPQDHSVFMAPIVAFANDLPSFVKYVKDLRDSMDEKRKNEIHEVYRTLLIRVAQQERRKRIDRACAVYEERVAKLSYTDRLAYQRKLEQVWGVGRMDYMKMHRVGKQRLTTDERADVLAKFWVQIEADIEKGEFLNV